VTGLEREQHKQIGQLSKGYKQRVGIAQAIIHNPEILILDEPTSGLDPNQLVEIRELIRTLGKEKTIMFSSHIMQEVEAVCDRIIIIDKGNIVKDDKVGGDGVEGKSQSVIVEFDEEVSTDDLSKIEGILKVESIGSSTYRLVSNSEQDLRKTISEWARSSNRLILALKFEDRKLEDVFRKHTT